MNKKITAAMLLVLIQSSIYSAQPQEDLDWMQVERAPGGELKVTKVTACQPTQDTAISIVSDQPESSEESPVGCCAVVVNLLEKVLELVKDQAYGDNPFGKPDPQTTAKNK
jgi:hypothetical protein